MPAEIIPRATTDRDQILKTAQALVTETFSRWAASAQSTRSTGTATFVSFPVRAGDVLTNVYWGQSVAGTAITLAKFGVYSPTGTLLASTADVSATMNSGTGLKTAALGTPYTVTADGALYACFVEVFTTTSVTLARAGLQAEVAAAVGTGVLPFGQQTGQTDLPSPATIAAGGGLALWIGFS